MTEEEAKEILRNDPQGNIAARREAIDVAVRVLGEDCTMREIWRWVDGHKSNRKEDSSVD